jgi:CheY-like chemotaxis protein
VVEDSEPFRRFFSFALQERSNLRIICQVWDGLEAVQKAEQLQPDLILLDIGLPRLNGIEAARRIRKVSPQSKILFVSQESSIDMVQEALSTGAWGYIVKSDAGRELVTAVNAILLGGRFVSSTFAGHDFTVIRDSESPDTFCNRKVDSPAPTWLQEAESASRHALRFYPDDVGFVEDFTRRMTADIRADNTVMVLGTDWFRASLLEGLAAGGVDVAAALERKRYIPVSVDVTLSSPTVGASSEPAQVAKLACDLIVEATKALGTETPRIAAY